MTQPPASELLRALENDLYPVLAQEDPHKAVDDILELRRRAWRALPALVELTANAEDFHSMMHPGGTQQMVDGSWQPCPGCIALANLRKALGG